MLLTVDIGTTIFKTAIWDFEGNRKEFVSSQFEFNPDSRQWLKAFEKTCRELKDIKSVEAIIICGNGPSLTPVFDKPLLTESGLTVNAGPVRFWTDRRAIEASRQVSAHIDSFVDPCFFLPKALDIKINEPQLYEKTKYFLGCPEFLAFALTGEAKTVFPSDGFERWFWNDSILESLSLDREKFPAYIRPGETFGGLNPVIAAVLGLKPDIPVLSGGPDFFAAIIGTGITKPGQACDRAGTSEGINLCTADRIEDSRFMSYGHPIKPFWNLSGVISSSGKAVEWGQKLLGLDYDDFFSLAEKSPAGAAGMVLIPCLAGGRMAETDASPHGMITGLNLETGREEFARSVLEGINFMVHKTIEAMEKTGANVDELRVTGGICRNSFMNQIKADITKKPVLLTRYKEAELTGLAIIGSCALGKYSSIKEAVSALVSIEKTFYPENTALYDRLTLF